MTRIVWSANALASLSDIKIYIAAVDGLAARRVIETIRDKVKRLRDFPLIGEAVPGELRKLSIHTARNWRPR